jgi:biotin carboxyl carrier protein
MEKAMKLKAEINNQEHELKLTFAGRRASVEIDGRRYNLEVREPEEGSYLLFADTHVYEARVNTSHKSRENFEVNLRGRSYAVSIADPKRLRSVQSAGRHQRGPSEIVASMPGKVVRVLVAEGAEVEAGAGILVVEAMKMQNELKSPRAGVVISVGVAPGDTVNAGDVLAVLE